MDQLKCHLVYLTGSEAGKSRAFDSARITLGRAANCDVLFDQYRDLAVASHHAEILYDEGMFHIHDLGTRSGTYVNGARVTDLHSLRNEDYIQLGKSGPEVIFRLGQAGHDPQPLPPPAPETGELEMITGNDSGKLFPVLGTTPTRIGRRADVEASLDPRGDMVVSGHHCTVEYLDDSFVLIDTSRNGTYLNGSLINGSCYLRDGDIITLGDGGPRARFRLHPPRRIYPNRSGEFPPLTEQTGPSPAMRQAAMQVRPQANVPAEPFDEPPVLPEQPTGEPVMPMPPPPAAPGATSATPPGRASRKAPKARIILFFAGGTVVVLLLATILAIALRGRGTDPALAPPQNALKPAQASTYEREIAGATSRRIAGGRYSVEVPAAWNVREDGAEFSMESPDRAVTVDYSRTPGLTEDAVIALLARNGAKVVKGESMPDGGIPVQYFHSTRHGRAVLAALHTPPNDTPALALVEAPPDLLSGFSDATLGRLLRTNLKLQVTEATVVATPGQTPPATADTPVPTPTPETAVAGTPAQTPAAAETSQARTVANRALGLQVELPSDWTVSSDEDKGVLAMRKPEGLEIRVARDPGVMDAAVTFKALEEAGYAIEQKSDSQLPVGGTERSCHVALLNRESRHVLLVLLDQPTPTTVVVYAVSEGRLSENDKAEVTSIVRQLALQAP